ncbi:UNVERIFIED_CONTAM: hypothetical protein HDU68_008242, partial [Siphonaria sp. JEL0065]
PAVLKKKPKRANDATTTRKTVPGLPPFPSSAHVDSCNAPQPQPVAVALQMHNKKVFTEFREGRSLSPHRKFNNSRESHKQPELVSNDQTIQTGVDLKPVMTTQDWSSGLSDQSTPSTTTSSLAPPIYPDPSTLENTEGPLLQCRIPPPPLPPPPFVHNRPGLFPLQSMPQQFAYPQMYTQQPTYAPCHESNIPHHNQSWVHPHPQAPQQILVKPNPDYSQIDYSNGLYGNWVQHGLPPDFDNGNFMMPFPPPQHYIEEFGENYAHQLQYPPAGNNSFLQAPPPKLLNQYQGFVQHSPHQQFQQHHEYSQYDHEMASSLPAAAIFPNSGFKPVGNTVYNNGMSAPAYFDGIAPSISSPTGSILPYQTPLQRHIMAPNQTTPVKQLQQQPFSAPTRHSSDTSSVASSLYESNSQAFLMTSPATPSLSSSVGKKSSFGSIGQDRGAIGGKGVSNSSELGQGWRQSSGWSLF